MDQPSRSTVYTYIQVIVIVYTYIQVIISVLARISLRVLCSFGVGQRAVIEVSNLLLVHSMSHWWSSKKPYEVKYADPYEPYSIMPRSLIPRFD